MNGTEQQCPRCEEEYDDDRVEIDGLCDTCWSDDEYERGTRRLKAWLADPFNNNPLIDRPAPLPDADP